MIYSDAHISEDIYQGNGLGDKNDNFKVVDRDKFHGCMNSENSTLEYSHHLSILTLPLEHRFVIFLPQCSFSLSLVYSSREISCSLGLTS